MFFYETARRTGIDRIAAMARRFGFGAPLGLDIPGERGGLMPTRDWKLATTGTSWQQGETVITGIGQGSVLATPLQLATMAARLVTGRAVVPHLLREERLPPGGDQRLPAFPALGIDPRHLALVLDGMNAVVNEQGGTAYAARITDPALAMGGKSGTSQVRRITQYERDHGVTQGHRDPLEGARPRSVRGVRTGRRAALCLRRRHRAWRRDRRRRIGGGGADLPRRADRGAAARPGAAHTAVRFGV